MPRRGLTAAVAGAIVVIVVGIGATAYYFGALAPAGTTTTTSTALAQTMITTTNAETMPSSSTMSTTTSSMIGASSTTTSMSTPVMSTTSSMSTATMTTTQSSTSGGAQLHITSWSVSANIAGEPVTATCGTSMPGSGANYIAVTDSGTAPSVITNLSFSYLDMATEAGAPTGTCTINPGTTTYITLSGIGIDMATSGNPFTVSLTGTNGGFVYTEGNLG